MSTTEPEEEPKKLAAKPKGETNQPTVESVEESNPTRNALAQLAEFFGKDIYAEEQEEEDAHGMAATGMDPTDYKRKLKTLHLKPVVIQAVIQMKGILLGSVHYHIQNPLADEVFDADLDGDNCVVITHIVRFSNEDETTGRPMTFPFPTPPLARRWKKDMNSLILKVALCGSSYATWYEWLIDYDAKVRKWGPKHMLPELVDMAGRARELVDSVPSKPYVFRALRDYEPQQEDLNMCVANCKIHSLQSKIILATRDSVMVSYQSEYRFGGKFKQQIELRSLDEYDSWRSRYAVLQFAIKDPGDYEEFMLLMRQFYLNHGTEAIPMDIRQIYALLMEKFPDHHEKWRYAYPGTCCMP